MQLFLKIAILGLFILVTAKNMFSQNYVLPVSSYSFRDSSVVDEMGNSRMLLQNKAKLYNDAERGHVMRFTAEDKSYAALDNNPLQSDSSTITFFFYWESADAGSWHQLFEIFDPETNSNIFFTPQNGWGGNNCSFISDKKEYSSYEAISAPPLEKDKWMHVAITVENKVVSIYINGEQKTTGNLNFTPSILQADSIFFGGNPHRTDNFYISARLDEIKIFSTALAANQVAAVYNEEEIPESEKKITNWETSGDPIQIGIDFSQKKQTIQNFGSSDGWNTERIGKYWPEDKKEKLAELLFSTEKDAHGNPKGIGLSAWRFNIGAGTTEQGDASRISIEERRTEGFLNPDGETYNWNKQMGQQYFLTKAALDYNIHHIIGWQNSPPVNYTTNNLGFREYGAPMATILKTEYFDDFARFLADVTEHFKSEGIHFDYISPLNEPQWGWAPSSNGGTVTQEGTPWTNQNIFDVVVAIDNEFSNRNIDTKLFIPEAGSINHITGGGGHASNQLYNFWNSNSSRSLVGKSSFANIVSYHSYFTDSGSELISQRTNFNNRLQELNPIPEAWQTEYSLLGNGYRFGYPAAYKLTEMECALSLARVMHNDLTLANTTGWQWWTTFEKGKHGGEARYCLIEAFTKNDNTDGVYHLNKLFYSFGNFSHFIRPGMQRLGISRSDNLTAYEQTSDVMFSAYTNTTEDKIVLVAVNTTGETRDVNLVINYLSGKELENQLVYLTDAHTNLSVQDVNWASNEMIVPAHSVLTFTADLTVKTSIEDAIKERKFEARYNASEEIIVTEFKNNPHIEYVKLYTISGGLVQMKKLEYGQHKITFSTAYLPDGIYLVSAESSFSRETKKVVVVRQ